MATVWVIAHFGPSRRARATELSGATESGGLDGGASVGSSGRRLGAGVASAPAELPGVGATEAMAVDAGRAPPPEGEADASAAGCPIAVNPEPPNAQPPSASITPAATPTRAGRTDLAGRRPDGRSPRVPDTSSRRNSVGARRRFSGHRPGRRKVVRRGAPTSEGVPGRAERGPAADDHQCVQRIQPP